VKSQTFFRRLWQLEHVTLDRNSSIGTTVARFFSALTNPLTGPIA
jgi:hypothetical protein